MNEQWAVKRFFNMLKLDRKEIIHVYLYAIFSGLITLSIPLGVQAIIGLIAGGEISAALIVLIAIVSAGTMLTGVLKVMQLTLTESIQRRLFARSSFEFAWRLPRIKSELLLGEYPPELVNRFFDTLTLQKGLPKLLTDTSTAILQIIFGLLLISFYHPSFVAFSLILLLVLVIIFYVSSPQGLATSMMESKYKYRVAHWLEEIGRVVNTFKLSGQSRLPMDKTKVLVNGYFGHRKAHFRILMWQYGAMVLFQAGVTLTLLYLGSRLVISNDITIGQFVAAEIVIIQVLSSVEKLILNIDTIYDMLTGVEKIGYVTDLELEDCSDGIPFEKIDNNGEGLEVDFKDVSFRFPDSQRCVVDKVNLHLSPGERVCLLGPNRSGKSTLIHLAGLLYTKYQGSITYNGFKAMDLEYQQLRQHIGDFMRDEDLFRASLIDNLWLHDGEPDLQQVRDVLDKVGLSDYIAHLPNGYQTELLPSGRNLPASVRTKLLLARTLMGSPRLLALGDFGTNLSSADRRQISDLLTDCDYKWTLLAVSDDPYFAKKCDRLIYIENGAILLEGTYEELVDDPRVAYVLGLSSYDPFHPTEEE